MISFKSRKKEKKEKILLRKKKRSERLNQCEQENKIEGKKRRRGKEEKKTKEERLLEHRSLRCLRRCSERKKIIQAHLHTRILYPHTHTQPKV